MGLLRLHILFLLLSVVRYCTSFSLKLRENSIWWKTLWSSKNGSEFCTGEATRLGANDAPQLSHRNSILGRSEKRKPGQSRVLCTMISNEGSTRNSSSESADHTPESDAEVILQGKAAASNGAADSTNASGKKGGKSPSEDPCDDLEFVEIDATLGGICREGLLQLLKDVQQQIPDLYRHLFSAEPSALEALSTEQLRSLLRQLLDCAEAADAEGEVTPTSGPMGDAAWRKHAVLLLQREQLHEQQKQHLAQEDGMQHLPEPLERAVGTAAAADSAAAVEAQELIDMGRSSEEQEGMFAALQEQLPHLTDADVWELLVAVGSVLEAFMSPEVHCKEQQQQQPQQQRQKHQQETELESVEQWLASTREERQSMLAEEAALVNLVQRTAGHLSSKGRQELLLTLVAVAEAEEFSPRDPTVRRLLRLDPADDAVSPVSNPPSGPAAAAANPSSFRSPSIVAAWRYLLQQPENAPAGDRPLSPTEAAALSDQEVWQRYSSLVKRSRGGEMKASLERCRNLEEPPAVCASPKSTTLPSELPADVRGPQGSSLTPSPGGVRHTTERGPARALEQGNRTRHLETAPIGTPSEPPDPTLASARTAAPTDPVSYDVPETRQRGKPFRTAVHKDAAPEAAEAPESPAETALAQSRSHPAEIRLSVGSPDPKRTLAVSSPETSATHEPLNLSKASSRFAALGLSPSVGSAAAAVLGALSKPTETQRFAIPSILRALKQAQNRRTTRNQATEKAASTGADLLVGLRAQTGSGKTLAFLLPLMQVLHEEKAAAAAAASAHNSVCEASYTDLFDCSALAEALQESEGTHRTFIESKCPRALVLCPSRPLAAQVASAASSLARHLRLSVVCATGGVGCGLQRRLLERQPLDILIGTPERLLQLTRPRNREEEQTQMGMRTLNRRNERLLSLAGIQYCILDEADALWFGGFRREVERLLSRSLFLREAPNHQHNQQARRQNRSRVLITCTATPESGAEEEIRELLELPAERFLPVEGVRAFPSLTRVRHEMMQVLGEDRFLLLCEQLRIQPDLRGKKIMVFCNTVSSCRACCHHLQSAGLPAEGYDGSLPASVRDRNLRAFQREGQRILVATDAVARGIDIGEVDAVVNADFPLTVVEYLHRAGRTGRAGSKGFVFSLVGKHEAAVAAAVRSSLTAGVSLEGVKRRVGEAGGARCSSYPKKRDKRFEVMLRRSGSKARRGGWKAPRSPEWHAARRAREAVQKLRRPREVLPSGRHKGVGSAT